ncbi:amidohydrolase family protein [Escherichia coli]|nr:amidohydrolase family protein [Escherichia coli]EFF6250390.1 amidohydrolase family protein [Escherichia coli]EJR8935781.1 amidohydrolase family protein [Escherichia coli]
MSVKIVIKPNTYFDSVSLMSISTRANKLDGVEQAFVAMATEMNKGVLKNLGLLTPELEQAKNGDLMIVINGKSGADNEQLLVEIEELFNTKAQSGSHEARYATIARSHCNIEPVSGLKNLQNLQAVLARRQAGFECEIVAFPQHGLLLSKSEPLMREAMQAGAHYVGGLDPTSVDGAMEKSLDTMFQIALDYDKGVDIHLHETTPSGVAAINYMVETVEKTPQLKGKLTISHAFALATLNEQQVDELAHRMAAQQISIASTVPIGTLHMPLKQLHDKGVKVMTGTDSVIDHWSPYGLGDMLEKANLYAQLYIRPNEQNLSRSLFLATGDVLPLNEKGERVWPKAQDDASFVLVDASCSAEAVARISPRTATFHKGQLVWGSVAG